MATSVSSRGAAATASGPTLAGPAPSPSAAGASQHPPAPSAPSPAARQTACGKGNSVSLQDPCGDRK